MRDAVGAWLDAAGRYPLLTPAEELHLGALVQAWQRWDGGPDAAPAPVQRRGLRARDRMVRGNLRLVPSVARRYSGLIKQRGLSLEDGLQEGVIGLMRGVEKFDPERGYKFSTFGYWWARQGIARWAHTGGLIRLPQNVAEQLCKLSPAEIAALPDRERATADAGLAALRMGWLDAPAGGGDSSPLSEFLASDDADQLEALADEIEAERLQAAAPQAWADGVAAMRCRGLRGERGRRILHTLRAA